MCVLDPLSHRSSLCLALLTETDFKELVMQQWEDDCKSRTCQLTARSVCVESSLTSQRFHFRSHYLKRWPKVLRWFTVRDTVVAAESYYVWKTWQPSCNILFYPCKSWRWNHFPVLKDSSKSNADFKRRDANGDERPWDALVASLKWMKVSLNTCIIHSCFSYLIPCLPRLCCDGDGAPHVCQQQVYGNWSGGRCFLAGGGREGEISCCLCIFHLHLPG